MVMVDVTASTKLVAVAQVMKREAEEQVQELQKKLAAAEAELAELQVGQFRSDCWG
jgi:hypothetical protein